MKIRSILELAPKTEEYSIINPANGEEFIFSLRPLRHSELSELTAGLKPPKPKEIGFVTVNGSVVKDDFGKPIPKFDEDNPEYKKALAKYNEDFVYSWLLACWDVEIPGDTAEEKIESLRANVPNWVFVELERKLQEIQGYRTSDVAYAKKKSAQVAADTLSMKSAKNGDAGSASGTP